MVEFRRWLTDIAPKKWTSMIVKCPSPTLVDLPVDIFANICELLSVRDILALRMTSKRMAPITREPIIWNSLLRRLFVPLPILPATSRNRFGEIHLQMYEKLLARALYLERNWRRQHPVASHSYFEVYDHIVLMKMLPGGKYMVTVTKNPDSEVYSLVVWDMDHEGRKLALTCTTSWKPYLKLDAKYGMICGSTSIVIACVKPAAEGRDRVSTTVVVFYVPILALENLAMLHSNPELFSLYANTLEYPFIELLKSKTSCEVGQLVLADFESDMVLLIVHRPRALVFHYLTSRTRGNLLLGPVEPYSNLANSIWTVKLLPSQDAVLVSRVIVENGMTMDSTLFALDMFRVPGPGSTYRNPVHLGRQLISGLHIDGFYFSDLETSWFTGLRDLEGMLPAPANKQPPPISVFATTNRPRGFIQWLLRPEPIPNQSIQLPDNRGELPRFIYSLPAKAIARDVWTDDYARPVVCPGAYRSIISMHPHVHPRLLSEDSRGIETLRFCTYGTPANLSPTVPNNWDDPSLRGRSLRVPVVPNEIAWNMMYGTTAIAFDESTGRMCVATNQDTAIHVLDFGGGSWEAAVVEP